MGLSVCPSSRRVFRGDLPLVVSPRLWNVLVHQGPAPRVSPQPGRPGEFDTLQTPPWRPGGAWETPQSHLRTSQGQRPVQLSPPQLSVLPGAPLPMPPGGAAAPEGSLAHHHLRPCLWPQRAAPGAWPLPPPPHRLPVSPRSSTSYAQRLGRTQPGGPRTGQTGPGQHVVPRGTSSERVQSVICQSEDCCCRPIPSLGGQEGERPTGGGNLPPAPGCSAAGPGRPGPAHAQHVRPATPRGCSGGKLSPRRPTPWDQQALEWSMCHLGVPNLGGAGGLAALVPHTLCDLGTGTCDTPGVPPCVPGSSSRDGPSRMLVWVSPPCTHQQEPQAPWICAGTRVWSPSTSCLNSVSCSTTV